MVCKLVIGLFLLKDSSQTHRISIKYSQYSESQFSVELGFSP